MKRALFVLAAALVAAATANPIVESVADSGVFGRGYADHDQTSVVPTLVVAAFFALALVVTRTVRALRGDAQREGVLAGLGRDLARRTRVSDLPAVIGLQFVALYAMERAECFAHGGIEGGFAWLGGPIVFAVAFHALTGLAMTFALGFALRSLARALETAVRAVLEAIALVRARIAAIALVRRTFDAIADRSLAHVRALRGRAPPFAPTDA